MFRRRYVQSGGFTNVSSTSGHQTLGWDVPPVPGQRSIDLFNPVPPVLTSERTMNIGFHRKNHRWYENPASHPRVFDFAGCLRWMEGWETFIGFGIFCVQPLSCPFYEMADKASGKEGA